MKQQRYSQKRELILENLRGRKDHPTAEQVYESLKQSGVSLPTVYRNLAQLSEGGEVLRLKTARGTDRFDADTSPHTHFECSRCGAMVDVVPAVAVDMRDAVPAGFSVSGYNLTLFGVCDKCKSNTD